jgi:[acyl-carrier-protein] S-malonyltransferase
MSDAISPQTARHHGDRPRAVLFCPGRGAYGRSELGFVTRAVERAVQLGRNDVAQTLARADAVRASAGRPTIRDLDGAKSFQPSVHLEGENAAELIWFGTVADAIDLAERYEICAVAGNSLGWYTALPVAGALSVFDGHRLVTTMARLQRTQVDEGGQILTTTLDEDWRPDPHLVRALEAAIQSVTASGEFLARSIRLGGHEVIAGSEFAIQRLLKELPAIESEARRFPFRLAGHGPFHTSLCQGVAETARDELASLQFLRPDIPLIDGFGNVHSRWSADPLKLFRYTTGEQVTETFDFTACVRTAMREFQPDVLVCAGPGTSLRAPVGHVVLAEGWRGVHDKAALFASGLVVASGLASSGRV